MFATGLAFLAGILIEAMAQAVPGAIWAPVLPLVLVLAIIAPASRPLLRLLLWALAGLLYASAWNQWRLEHRLEAELNNRRLVAVGEVKSIPRLIERKEGYARSYRVWRFDFRLSRLLDVQGRVVDGAPRLVRLNWRNGPESLEPGQIWRLPLRLRQPHGYANEGAFDYERWLWMRGIDATGKVLREPEAEYLGESAFSLARWRHRLVERLKSLCQGCRHVGLIEALSVGYRGDLPGEEKALLRQTGTAHLVAISGLHIGMVALCFHWLGGVLWRCGLWRRGYSRRSVAWGMAFVGGLLYALLSGLALPALRAAIMLAVLWLGHALGRHSNLLDSLGLALLLVLLMAPLSVLSPSLWMSFAALCVIAFGLWRWPQSAQETGWRGRVSQGVRIQALFSLLFLPLGLAVFGEIHRASLLANLVAVPLVSLLIVPFNFLLLAITWFPDGLLIPAYQLLNTLLSLMLGFLEGLREAGLSAWILPAIPGWLLLWLTLGLVALMLPRAVLRAPVLWALLPFMLLWPNGNHSRDIPRGSFVAEVLDVGMGTALLIRTREHSLVYDFGPGRTHGFSMGRWAVLPLLKRRGIHVPDRIILSHEDQDHIGGFLALEERWRDRVLDTGTPARTRKKIPAHEAWRDCHRAAPWSWDGVSFRYLTAGEGTGRSENDRSCVLRVESLAGAVLLISGDIEQGQERRLLERNPRDLSATVLIAPHHGSESSSTPDFVTAVSPRDVVFTTGFLNRWGFPRAPVAERYLQRGARLWNTAITGQLRIDCGAQCRVSARRFEQPRPWRGPW